MEISLSRFGYSIKSDKKWALRGSKMTQNSFINFLGSRRSVTAKKMERGRIDKDHLRQILSVGIRVPDHER